MHSVQVVDIEIQNKEELKEQQTIARMQTREQY